ncbi:MAG: AbrB/MazE/SpoVT family DNA-binding domain-containing protein [Nanoarchaeota archaeon]
MELEAITRKWGNSIAIVIPARVVQEQEIKENEKVEVKIERKKPLLVRDVFGMLKGKIARPTEEIMEEIKAGWLSASDREREAEWKKQKK